MALACETSVLIADEATSALDVVSQAHVVEALRAAQDRSDLALLIITHDIAVAAQLCDRVVVLHDGTVVEAGPMRRILGDPQHEVTREIVAHAVPGTAAS